MTIKKRIFYSNLLMVILPLVTSILMGAVFFFSVKEFILNPDAEITEINEMNQSLHQIQKIIEDTDANLLSDSSKTQKDFMKQLTDLDFHICGIQEGKVLFTSLGEKEQSELSDYIVQEDLYNANQTLWVKDDNYFLLWRRLKTDTLPITLIAMGDTDENYLSGAGNTAAFITVSLVIISAIIFIVILISLYLANKLLNKVMIPLNALCDGAKRIRDGNYEQDILYQNAEELDNVCETFNQMQHQLKENLKKSELYERDRNEMLAGISHDLRSPLTSIKSYVKGLQDDIAKTPDKQKEYLDIVYRKTLRIEELINSLFLFSKLKTGKFPFDYKLVSIQNFIVTLLDSMEYDFQKNNAVLTLISTCTNQKVLIDGAQMTRAITNILDNSIKYNRDRNVAITVTLSESNGKIVIRIQDDGVGVTKEQLQRLFDSFYRGDESRNNATEGSGLGLAIAKNIVTANHGNIYAESNCGLTVIIELPVEKEEHQ